MMDISQTKIQKTSKTLATFLRITQVVLMIDIFVQIAAIVWVAVTPESVVGFEIGSIRVFSPFTNNLDVSESQLIALLGTEIFRQSLMVIMLFIASAIFREISREYTPFSSKHAARLKKISLWMLALIILPPFVELVLNRILAPTAKLTASFELSNIVFVVIFYCLAQIFDYGRMLQKQSDETL